MNTEIVRTNTLPLFEKRTVAELSDIEMMNIDGGTTTLCAIAASSEPCAMGAVALYIIIANAW